MCSVSLALLADSLLLSHRGSPYIVIKFKLNSNQLNSNTDNAPVLSCINIIAPIILDITCNGRKISFIVDVTALKYELHDL